MKKIILLVSLTSSTSFAVGLKEAIKYAIQNNPRTEAIDLRVQAMQDRNKAQWLDLLPTLRVSSSTYFSNTQVQGMPGTQSVGRTNSVGMSVNLYNGGADRASLRASQERLKSVNADYNSSNSRIPNTRGSFASSVFESYLSLVENYEQKKFVTDLGQKLEQLKKSSLNEEERKTLNQRIVDLKTSMVNVEFGISEAQKDFSYFTTMPAPEVNELETLEQLRRGLAIPQNAELAYQEALIKSPDIQSINHRLSAETYERDAEKRRMFRPRVDLNASYDGRHTRSSDGPATDSRGAYVGVSVSYTFDAGSVYRNRAGNKELEATRSDREAMLADVQYNLNSSYQSLANLERVYSLQQQNLQNADDRLAEIYRKIERGEKVEFKDMMAAVDMRSGYWQQNLHLNKNIINMHFNLQRTVGTLFDEISLSLQERSSIK